VNYKRKSRRRFFLLVRSRTSPISSEFRGGGLNTPNPPPRYATAVRGSRLPTDHSTTQPVTKYSIAVDRQYLLGPTIFVRALHWRELHLVEPFTARFSKFRIYYRYSAKIQVFKFDSSLELLEEICTVVVFPVNTVSNRSLPSALTLTKKKH